MNDYVVGASALVLARIGKTDDAAALRQRVPGMRVHAPHLVDAEVGNIVRRHERAGRISTAEADAAMWAAPALVGHRFPHGGALGWSAWPLRHSLSFYGALYVALASHLGIPLLAGDARRNAPGLPCRIELT